MQELISWSDTSLIYIVSKGLYLRFESYVTESQCSTVISDKYWMQDNSNSSLKQLFIDNS